MRRRPRPLGTPFSLLGKDGFDRKTSRVRSRDDPPWETGAAVGGKGRGPVPRVTPLPRTRLASQRKGKRHGVREGNRSPIRPEGGRTHRTPNEILCDDGHRAGKKRPKVTDGPGRQGSIVEATSPRRRGRVPDAPGGPAFPLFRAFHWWNPSVPPIRLVQSIGKRSPSTVSVRRCRTWSKRTWSASQTERQPPHERTSKRSTGADRSWPPLPLLLVVAACRRSDDRRRKTQAKESGPTWTVRGCSSQEVQRVRPRGHARRHSIGSSCSSRYKPYKAQEWAPPRTPGCGSRW